MSSVSLIDTLIPCHWASFRFTFKDAKIGGVLLGNENRKFFVDQLHHSSSD